MPDILDEAETRFRALQSYRVTLHAEAGDGERHVMRYGYRRPGWVRIDCIDPHDGVVLIYDPDAGRARVWLFGLGLEAFSLAPDNPLLRGPGGHRIDRSDVGALLEDLQTMRARGRLSPLAGAQLAGRAATGIEVEDATASAGDGAHRHHVWFASETLFPLRVDSFGAGGETIETVEMTDAELDVSFPERFFAP